MAVPVQPQRPPPRTTPVAEGGNPLLQQHQLGFLAHPDVYEPEEFEEWLAEEAEYLDD